jgi:branched-chain amino acid transport system substrate-binding protein
MMIRTHRLATLLTALTLLVAACGGNGGEGAGEATGGEAGGGQTAPADGGGEPIVIGAIFDLSGATADVGTPFADGVQAYVDWLNNDGGIEGRPVELLSADYAYDVANAEQLYSQYVSEGAVAFSGWGTGDTEALRTRVASDEVPFVSASYSEQLTDPQETPYNFVVALSYSDQLRVVLRHLAEQADGHIEVAVFHHDSPFGESPLEDGRAYIEEQGLDIGFASYAMPTGATDFVGQLTQAQEQGAQYVIVQNVSSPAATLASNIADQGLDMTVVCLNWCGDELYVELAGDAAEGSLGVLPWEPPSQVDDLGPAGDYLEESGTAVEDIDLHFTQGWYQTSVLGEAIRQVIASGEEVSGPNVKTALEEMEPYDTPVSEPIDFSADDHAGMQSARVYEVQDGEWNPVTDAITP